MDRAIRNALLGAITEDTISSLVPGTSTAKFLAKRIVPSWLKTDHYLAWDNVGLTLQFYREELDRFLRFRTNGKVYIIPQVLEVDNTDFTITLSKIRFRTTSEPFSLDNGLVGSSNKPFHFYRAFLRTRLRKYFNGQLLRLSGISSENGCLYLLSQPVFYESVCRTNLILDAKEAPTQPSIRETVHPDGRLDALESSRLANPLGVNFLLFTADGRAVMPKRSRRVIVRPKQLSPSFAGDFEYTDAGASRLRKSVVIREGFEEISLLEKHMVNGKTRFLGLTRELIRGGKPEMFFVAETSLTEKDFHHLHKNAKDQYEFMSPRSWVFWPFGEEAIRDALSDNDKYMLRRSFDEFLKRKGNMASIPLLTALVLWLRQKSGIPFSG